MLVFTIYVFFLSLQIMQGANYPADQTNPMVNIRIATSSMHFKPCYCNVWYVFIRDSSVLRIRCKVSRDPWNDKTILPFLFNLQNIAARFKLNFLEFKLCPILTIYRHFHTYQKKCRNSSFSHFLFLSMIFPRRKQIDKSDRCAYVAK